MTKGVAVIGLGEISKVHLSAIDTSPDFHLACVADIVEKRARDEAAKYGCAWENNLERVLRRSDIDVVDLLLPHDEHYRSIVRCLEEGRPVLCEKPIAFHTVQAQDVIRRSASLGIGVHIRMYQHFIRPVAAFLNLIMAGTLGHVHFLEFRARGNFLTSTMAPGAWHGTWSRAGGGTLLETGIHFVDLALSLFGMPQHSQLTAASIIETEDRAEDTALLALQWSPTKLALIGIESADPAEFFTFWMRASGDKGSADVVAHGDELLLRLWPPISRMPRAANEPLQRGQSSSYTVLERQSNWWWEANTQAVIEGLHLALNGGKQKELERAALSVQLIRAAYESFYESQP
jgi:predicted dehydrogenase